MKPFSFLFVLALSAASLGHGSNALSKSLAETRLDPNSILLEFPSTQKGKVIQVGGFLLLPETEGKAPAMIIMHGSGGVRVEHEYAYAYELNKMGVAAFILDSFTSRNVVDTYDDQSLVSATADMVNDASVALRVLAQQKRIDPKRIGIVGFSKGGIPAFLTALKNWKTRAALSRPDDPKFKLHVMVYPGCATQPFDMTTTGAPMLVMMGEKDAYTGTRVCLNYVEKLKAAGANIRTILYAEAPHAWDLVGPWSHPHAEIFKECQFEQQADLTWRETTSGVTNIPRNLVGEKYHQALRGCLSYGVNFVGSPEISQLSLADFNAFIKENLVDQAP